MDCDQDTVLIKGSSLLGRPATQAPVPVFSPPFPPRSLRTEWLAWVRARPGAGLLNGCLRNGIRIEKPIPIQASYVSTLLQSEMLIAYLKKVVEEAGEVVLSREE